MKTKNTFLILLMVVVVFSSCKKETEVPVVTNPKSTKDIQAAADFTWTTSRTVSVNLSFMYNSQVIGNVPFTLYAGSESTGKVIYSGTSNSDGNFRSVFKIADIY